MNRKGCSLITTTLQSKGLYIPSIVTDSKIVEILKNCKTVAVIGCSRNPNKDSHIVAKYLIENGYEVYPVNPKATEILGRKCYRNLLEIEKNIDIVVVFRPPEEVPKIAEEVIKRKTKRGDVKVLWLQLGITANPQTRKKLKENGILLIENRCIKIEHERLLKNSEETTESSHHPQ